MPDFVDGASEKQVADQSMPMGRHGNEIALLNAGSFEDFLGRIAKRELECDGQSLTAQLPGCFFQILAVFAHFFRLGELQPIIIPRNPTVGNMHQQKFRTKLSSQFADVRDQAVVRATVF